MRRGEVLFPGVFAERNYADGHFVVTEELVNTVLGVILGNSAKKPLNYLRGGSRQLLQWVEQCDDVMMFRAVEEKSRYWKVIAPGGFSGSGRTIAIAIAAAILDKEANLCLDSSETESTIRYLALTDMVEFLRTKAPDNSQRSLRTSEKESKVKNPTKGPEWLCRASLLKNRKYTTSQLQGVLADSSGVPPSNRAIHSAFRRRGLRPVSRTEGMNPESVWSGQKIRDLIIMPQSPLF